MAALAQNQIPHPWVRGAAWALGLSVAVVGALASAMYDHDRTATRERLNSLESRVDLSCSEVGEHLYRTEDAVMADLRELARALAAVQASVAGFHGADEIEWKRRIIKLEEETDSIKHQAAARHDPFTGTEGDELSRLINEASGRLRRLEYYLGVAPQD